MPSVPRILHTVPSGPVAQASEPIPVIATLEWADMHTSETEALAVAWTREHVEIEWLWNGQTRRDWVAAWQVRRPGQPPKPVDRGNAPPRLDTRKRRW